ncbi:hypothetical protein COEREDRAFT_78977 [Coemansia reversa NRRL 1564]|uniref:NudC domain-containing protein 1 n=1 Tax=Coemansia reversa (strain ATCC 12441 / NRRL 1564) TaxID=763665 RepID=A0A2G5BKX7_COERN|nr:hypothetical protein COEREDRAFT_78977 [Coemansia reversa NRRL 1564]|eukprot:PIA19674.1 hypothetical protein COEREDRAFT_78977 [Coemansia reversa NRRL 1564]
MAYRVLDFRPDSALLNSNFDGYKLRLPHNEDASDKSVLRIYQLNSAPVEPQRLPNNALLTYDEVYSRIHYNHLFAGPRQGTVIYIDQDRHVILVEFHKEGPPRFCKLFDIPPCINTNVFLGYPGAYSLTNTMVLIFDGIESIYALQRMDANSNNREHWLAVGVFEIGMGRVAAGPHNPKCSRIMYYILNATLASFSEGASIIRLHTCCRIDKEAGYAGEGESSATRTKDLPNAHPDQHGAVPTFCVQAIEVNGIPDNIPEVLAEQGTGLVQKDIVHLNVSVVHTLHTHAIPVYCEFLDAERYILGVKGGVVLDDTEITRERSSNCGPMSPAVQQMQSEPYYWTQTASDVTVCIDLPASIKANQILCEISRTSLTLQFDTSAEYLSSHTYTQAQFCDFIVADESVWTLENGRILTLYLQKEHDGARWATVFANDDGVLETMDSNEFAMIRERLEKYTAADYETHGQRAPLMQPFLDQDTGGDIDQLEEASELTVMFSIRDWHTGVVEASSVVGSPEWLCAAFPPTPTQSATKNTPPICLKHDVDGIAFKFTSQSTDPCPQHVGTFSALSYIQGSKREKRFFYIDTDMTIAVIAEAQRRLYIYHQVPNPGASSAAQNVIDLGGSGEDAEILGVQLANKSLVVLGRNSICQIDVDKC